MLAYSEVVDVSDKPHQQRLLRPPTIGVRSWRHDMSADGRDRVRGSRR
jgi:hypothetical protein